MDSRTMARIVLIAGIASTVILGVGIYSVDSIGANIGAGLFPFLYAPAILLSTWQFSKSIRNKSISISKSLAIIAAIGLLVGYNLVKHFYLNERFSNIDDISIYFSATSVLIPAIAYYLYHKKTKVV